MSAIAWTVIGALGASLIWIFAIAWLLDVIAAQRKALTDALVNVRLYRETRTESDRQVHDLLSQNERLAIQLIEAKASTTTPVISVPASLFRQGVES